MLTEDIKRHTSYTFAMYPMGEYKEIKMDVGHFACVFDIKPDFDPTPEAECLYVGVKRIVELSSFPAWVEIRRDKQKITVHLWDMGTTPAKDIAELSDDFSAQAKIRMSLQKNIFRSGSQVYFIPSGFELDFSIDSYMPNSILLDTVLPNGEPCCVIESGDLIRYSESIGKTYNLKSFSNLAKAAQRIIDLAAPKPASPP